MGVELLILLLIIFMLVASLIAGEAEDLLGCVIAVGATGFGLSVIDLLVGAPDLAITQVVVEIISVVLLIRVVLTRRDTSTETPRDALRIAAVLLGGGVLLAAAFLAFGGGHMEGTVPPFGQAVLTNDTSAAIPPGVGAKYLAGSAEQTGAANAVMAIVLDYRGYDTLGEATIILVAIMGAYATLRVVGRKKKNTSGGEEEVRP